eukprot:scaffold109285_cov45-Phaeocystis_antarctica.AAC.3
MAHVADTDLGPARERRPLRHPLQLHRRHDAGGDALDRERVEGRPVDAEDVGLNRAAAWRPPRAPRRRAGGGRPAPPPSRGRCGRCSCADLRRGPARRSGRVARECRATCHLGSGSGLARHVPPCASAEGRGRAIASCSACAADTRKYHGTSPSSVSARGGPAAQAEGDGARLAT